MQFFDLVEIRSFPVQFSFDPVFGPAFCQTFDSVP